MRNTSWVIVLAALVIASTPAAAQPVLLPYQFTPNTPAMAGQVNANFDTLATAIDRIRGEGRVYWVNDVEQLEDAIAAINADVNWGDHVIMLSPRTYDLLTPLRLEGGYLTLVGLGRVEFNLGVSTSPVVEIAPYGALSLEGVALLTSGPSTIVCEQGPVMGSASLRRSNLSSEIVDCDVNLVETYAQVRIDSATSYPTRWVIAQGASATVDLRNANLSVSGGGVDGTVVVDDPAIVSPIGVRVSRGNMFGLSLTGLIDVRLIQNEFYGALQSATNATGTPAFVCRDNFDNTTAADVGCP